MRCWKYAAVLALASLGPVSAHAALPPAPPDLQGVVNEFVAALNGTKAEPFIGLFAQQASITDTLGAYNWQGQEVPARYFAALQAELKQDGWSDLQLAANGADTVMSNGATAYAAVPLFVNYTVNAAKHQDRGIFVLTFARFDGGWKITSATWTYTAPPS